MLAREEAGASTRTCGLEWQRHLGRAFKAKCTGHAGEVETGQVEGALHMVGGVGEEVGTVGLLGRLAKVVVLRDKALELGSDVGELAGDELKLSEGEALLAEVGEEGSLRGQQKKQSASCLVITSGCATYAVDVVLGVVGWVELEDPVDVGEVEAALGDVGAEEDALPATGEVEEDGRATGLLLAPVDVEDRQVNIVEEVCVELDGGARAHEDDDLLLAVASQEREEQPELFLRRDHHVALLQPRHRRHACRSRVHHNRAPQRQPHQVLHLLRLRRRKQQRLSLGRQQSQDLGDLLLEADPQNGVGLVHHQKLQLLHAESICVLQMVQQPPWRSYHETCSFPQLRRLVAPLRPSHHHCHTPSSQLPLPEEPLRHLSDLNRQLPCRRDDQHRCSLLAPHTCPH